MESKFLSIMPEAAYQAASTANQKSSDNLTSNYLETVV